MAACKQKSALGDYLQECGKILTSHNQTTNFWWPFVGGCFFSNQIPTTSTFIHPTSWTHRPRGGNSSSHPWGGTPIFIQWKSSTHPKTAPSELVGFHSPTYLPRFLTSQVLDGLLVFCCWKKGRQWSLVHGPEVFRRGGRNGGRKDNRNKTDTEFFPFEYYIKTWQATKYHKRYWS